MRLYLYIIIFAAALSVNLNAQTAVECLRDYYLSGITSPANLNNTKFTGIKLTVTGATSSTYMTYPVTATVSGNFVRMRGNNGITANVDYTTATPTFASANALLVFTQGCTPLSSGGSTGDNWGTQTVQHDATLLGQGIIGNELKIDTSKIATIYYNNSTRAVRQFAGRPTSNPSSTDPHIWHNLTNGYIMQYKSGIWYTQGTITATSAPVITETLSGITVSNIEAEWYNPTNQVYYRVVGGSGGAWQSLLFVDVNSIVYTTGNQTIAGEKTMTDTFRVTKGIVAGTSAFTGSSTKAAVSTTGVQQETYTIVSSNTTLNGTYYEVAVNTASSDINITLPTATSSNKGWKFVVHKTSETLPNKIRVIRPFSTDHLIYGGVKVFKSDGTDWIIQYQ